MNHKGSVVKESDEIKKERYEIHNKHLILSFVDLNGTAQKNLDRYSNAFESWVKNPNRKNKKNHTRRKQNFKASWTTYQEHLQVYVQKNEFAENHGVCDWCSEIAEKHFVCVFCNVCVHPVPDCCRFQGEHLSCMECYNTRHVYITFHPSPRRASVADSSTKDDAPKRPKSPPYIKQEPSQVDDRKPAAKNVAAKLKEPPKPALAGDSDDDKKPAAKNKEDKNKRKTPKLPMHSSLTAPFAASIGKSPRMNWPDMYMTTSPDDSHTSAGAKVTQEAEVIEPEPMEDIDDPDDKHKLWKVLTTLKERDRRNLKNSQIRRKLRGERRQNQEGDGKEVSAVAALVQKREERKIELEKKHGDAASKAELKRLEKATARASMSVPRREIEKCIDNLEQTWKKGARKNVIQRVQQDLSTMWPITSRTELNKEREWTQFFKIRYTPQSDVRGVPFPNTMHCN